MSISKTPWKATIGDIGGPIIQSADDKFIAYVRAKFIRIDTETKLGKWKLEDAGEESAENARLIAAAPDLLVAWGPCPQCGGRVEPKGKK